MIHNVILIETETGDIVVRSRFWKIEFGQEDIQEFLRGYHDLHTTEGLSPDTPVFVSEVHKVFHAPVSDDLLLLFVTDGRDEDRVIQYKIREGSARVATALRGNSMSYIKDNIEDILGELIFTRFKISFVGSGGVGKSTLLRLLFGREPAPGGYVPTINVAVDSSETIQFGTFLVTIWDFAGQAVFQDLWSFYFQGTDVIFLITDSSFRNVMQTKTLLRNIKKEAPAVPLFIVANKQDLPESMRAEKIKRLLGAPTFPMVATNKSRREEFIRFMLEVAAKTVGVQLPDRPISEMITVRRKTEDVDKAGMDSARTPHDQSGYETVPYQEDGSDTGREAPSSHEPSGIPLASEVGDSDTAIESSSDGTVASEVEPIQLPTKVISLILLIQQNGMFNVVYHLDYSDNMIDVNSVASLISALDSFGGIDPSAEGTTDATDALETIEHEGNLVMVEKSKHFVLALIVTNDNEEELYRQKMAGLLVEIEDMFHEIWADWNGDMTVFETSVFNVLGEIPLVPISLDYMVRAREAGRGLPFANRDVGRSLVEVKTAIDGTLTVGGLVRSLDLPREKVLGCLQIMKKFDWITFQVDLDTSVILKKISEPDPEKHVKPYGPIVIKFVNLCDGKTPLGDIVKKLKLSFAAMKFVATMLVLDGVLEIVA